MDLPAYKTLCIKLIEKTHNPIAPFALQNVATGGEQLARVIAPLCNEAKVHKLTARMLKDFTDEELNGKIGGSPEMVLAALAILKNSVIKWQSGL